MEKQTAKPTAAGVLGTIAGVIGIIIGIVLIAVGGPVGYGIALLILGFLAILGSSQALARSNFAVALIGAIAAFFAIWPLGLPAIILTSLSRNEFKTSGFNITITK